MHKRLVRRSLQMTIGIAVAAVIAACSSKETTQQAVPPVPSGLPQTYGMLQLMPESATGSVAIPSLSQVDRKLEALLMRAAPEGVNMEAEIKVALRGLATQLGVSDAYTVADIALAKGINPDKPAAVFFGMPEPESEEADTEPAEEAAEVVPAADVQAGSAVSSIAPGDVPVVIVAPISDAADAERTILEALQHPHLSTEELDDLGITIHVSDDKEFSYFIRGDYIVAGMPDGFVREVAGRMLKPGDVRYGTGTWPARSDDEIVGLVRTDRVAAYLKESEGVASETTEQSVEEQLDQIVAALDSPDPMVVTLQIEEDRIDLLSQIDHGTHPELTKWTGEAAPLLHATLMPPDTMAILSVGLSDAMLKQGRQSMESAMGSQDVPSPMAQIPPGVSQLLEQLGHEISVAVTGVKNDQPQAALLIDFKDGEGAKTTLRNMGMFPLVSETYNGIDIMAFPIPVGEYQIQYAIAGNKLVAATDGSQLKTFIDLVTGGKTTDFLASQDPPIDASVPRQSLFLAQGGLVKDAVIPMLVAFDFLSGSQSNWAEVVATQIKDVRAMNEKRDNWQSGQILLRVD